MKNKVIIKIFALKLCFMLFLCISCAAINASQYKNHDDNTTNKVKYKILEILNSPDLKQTKTGIKVVSLKTGQIIFDQDSEKLFVPASNLKLITALTALKILKPEYKFKTEIFTDKIKDDTTINNLYLKGSGDPSLNFSDLNKVALQLEQKIKKIDGNIIADKSYFDNIEYGKGWMWDEGIEDYNAPISAINLNRNCIDIYINAGNNLKDKVNTYIYPPTKYARTIINAGTTNKDDITIERKTEQNTDYFLINGELDINSKNQKFSCTVSRPAIYTLTVFKELLEKYGIQVAGNLKKGILPKDTLSIAFHESAPLTSIIGFFLKESDNLTGECLLKSIGAFIKHSPGTSDKGVDVVQSLLKEIGIENNIYRIVDGSGLSRYNLISPSLLIKVLEYAYKDFTIYPEFISALPLSGVDGTLKKRMKGNRTERKVRAKTGTMSGVSCVSGYLSTQNNELLAVSIMMNGYIGSSKPFTNAQDEILNILEENL